MPGRRITEERHSAWPQGPEKVDSSQSAEERPGHLKEKEAKQWPGMCGSVKGNMESADESGNGRPCKGLKGILTGRDFTFRQWRVIKSNCKHPGERLLELE